MAGRFRGATAAGLIVLTGSIAPAAQPQGWSSPSSSPPPARGPSIAILTPKAGSTVHGRTVRVSVFVKGFKVVDKQFQPRVAREGHVHF